MPFLPEIIETLFFDIRYGLRYVLKQPRFSTSVVVSLALGIAATKVVFSLINDIPLHPMPYQDADRLVFLWERSPQHDN